MASGHVNRIKRPNTWLHRPMLQNVKKVLANPEPSTHGTFENVLTPAKDVRTWTTKIGNARRINDANNAPRRRTGVCLICLCIGADPYIRSWRIFDDR